MNLELAAATRDNRGKGAARGVRREKRVPAVLYGPKTEAMSLSVSSLELERLLRATGGESKLLNLNIDGQGTAKQVLIREVQVHPFKRRFLHVDFYEVPLDQAIVVEVPIILFGDAIGVQKGGEINLIRRTLFGALPAEPDSGGYPGGCKPNGSGADHSRRGTHCRVYLRVCRRQVRGRCEYSRP